MPAIAWLNGALVAEDEARISPLDRGWLYGDGLFETMRAYRGRVFRREAHLERLWAAAERLRLTLPFTQADVARAIDATLAANGLADARLRLTVSRGAGEPRPDLTPGGAPTLFITARDLGPHGPEGYRAVLASGRINQRSPLAGLKTLNFLANLLARQEARDAGVEEAVMLDGDGRVAEGSISNLFWASGDRLFTPSLATGCIPGITRAVVLGLAATEGIPAQEVEEPPDSLASADEAFLTNAVIELSPLVEFRGHPVGGGEPGPLTRRLRRLYRVEVEHETGSVADGKG